MKQEGLPCAAARGGARSVVLWAMVTALVGISVVWGVSGVVTAFMIIGLVAGFFAAWMLWGLTASSMNSQGMTYAFPHEQQMHQGPGDARRTHSAGIRIIGLLILVSAASFGLGFALRHLSTNL